MTTNTNNGFRGFAIAALLTVGIVTTIATGGGGGDGMGPTPSGGPTLALTVANAPTVSSTLVIAIGTAFDLGDITGAGLPLQAGGLQPGISAPKSGGGFQLDLAVAEAPDIRACVNGGTVDISMTVADPNTLTVGDRIVAVFDQCDDNEGFVISGTADLTVSSYEGDILTEVFLLGFDVTFADILIEDSVESVTANGTFTLTFDSRDFPVQSLTLAGAELEFGAAGEVVTLTDFDHFLEVDFGVIPETIFATASGTLEIQSLGGTVDYATPVAVEAVDDLDAHTGEILITGADDSTIRIVIVDTENVTLEIDINGDGVVDEYVYTNWSVLNGNT